MTRSSSTRPSTDHDTPTNSVAKSEHPELTTFFLDTYIIDKIGPDMYLIDKIFHEYRYPNP